MFYEEVENHLREKIIPFWKKLRDNEFGGYYGLLNYDLQLDRKAEKGCILNSRITWFFSTAYSVLRDESLLSYAKHGYEFMKNACFDKEFGGVFWSLNYDGTVKDSIKHTYNQAFCIYALCAYYEATNEKEALDYAIHLFELIEQKCTDAYGYMEAFTRDFRPHSNEKLSENGVLAEKTMNTLLHLLEAYTQLYKVSKLETVKRKLIWIVNVIEHKVYNPYLERQEVFFDKEYNSILDLYSYGHDIEASWLIDLALEIIGEQKLTDRMSAITRKLTHRVYETAFDGRSLAIECEKGKVDERRVWWAQAENVVGMLNGYEKEPEKQEYLDAATANWEFIKEYMVDKRGESEWYWEVSKEGIPYPDRPIVEPWKCPYHNGRMCLEVIKRKERIV